MGSREEAAKAFIARFFDEVWNQGKVEVVEEFVAPDYVSHNKLGIDASGPEGIRQAVLAQRAAFPDLVSRIEDSIAEHDKVVVRGVDRGTFVNAFMGLPPTGRTFTITWIDIFRIEEGLLKEAWLEIDSEDFRRQLGGE